MINIDNFCGKDDIRSYLHSPTIKDGYIYASNGHIAIRVPSKLENTKNPSDIFVRSVVRIFADVDAKITGSGENIPDLSHVEKETACEDCGGLPKNKTCGTCDGDGEFEHDGYDYDCKTCDGDGEVTCESCGGSGKAICSTPINIGQAFFSSKYLSKLSELASVKMHIEAPYEAAFFTFDGGIGAIMPIRV